MGGQLFPKQGSDASSVVHAQSPRKIRNAKGLGSEAETGAESCWNFNYIYIKIHIHIY